MKKNFDSILVSILFGISILLGLSFWLNIKFNFNLFSAQHWDELSKLQAAHTPISFVFYISIGIAIFLFISGLYMIFKPKFRNIFKNNKEKKPSVVKPIIQTPVPPVIQQQNTVSHETHVAPEKKEEPAPQPQINGYKPHRLNLPKNIETLAAEKYSQQNVTPKIPQKNRTEFNDTLAEIFNNNNYLSKKIPVIAGFEPNLFAIGSGEVVWIGGIDCDITKLKDSVEKLSEVFEDTLSDITIQINAFLIDTLKRYEQQDDEIKIFNTIEDLKQFISEKPGNPIEDNEDFEAYSEYIDTVTQYIKNT